MINNLKQKFNYGEHGEINQNIFLIFTNQTKALCLYTLIFYP